MSKVFVIILVLISCSVGVSHSDGEAAPTEELLLSAVNTSLDATVRCYKISLPIGSSAGNLLGKEISIWWRKKQIKRDYITPLFDKVQTLKAAENAQKNIIHEVEIFEATLFDQAIFKKCSEQSEVFFKNVRTYIEKITAQINQ